jgi:hypothetical protein
VSVLVLCLVQFVDVLGVTVVVTALPTMVADLGASPDSAALLVTAYAMFFGGLLVLGARCGDRYGHRRVLLTGVAVFGVASVLAAVAPSLWLLVAARSLQGAAAALSVPAALRLVSTGDEDRRRRALALWSAAGAAAGASGFLLGGVVTQAASWRAIFWGSAGLALVLLAALRVVPGGAAGGGSLDVAGAVVLTGAVMALVVGASVGSLPLVLVGLALVPVLVAVERRQAAPLLPGAAVRDRHLRAGTAASFLLTATTSSIGTLATLRLQEVDGRSAVAAGLLLVPFSLAVVPGAAGAAPLLRRRRPAVVLTLGLGLVAAGSLALAATGGAAVPVWVAVAGLGLGLASVAANTTGTDVPAALAGVASGTLNTAAQLGTALGVAVILLVASLAGDGSGPASGATAGWLAAGLLAAAGAAAFIRSAD